MHEQSAIDDTAGFVARLAERGIAFERDGIALKVSAPKGAIDKQLAAEITERKPAILALLATAETSDRTAIPRVARTGPQAMGFVQQRMWVHARLEPDTVLYNLPAAWRFTGALDRAAFEAAFADFVGRHEVMRLSVEVVDGIPLQVFAATVDTRLDFEDIAGVAADEREHQLMLRLGELRDDEIDLASGRPYRARLFRLAADQHVFFFMPHHVVWDGWSFDIFLRDLNEFYCARRSGREPRLPQLPIDYADYANWHRGWLASGALDRELDYWASQLGGELVPLELPLDQPRPRLFSHRGDWEEFTIDQATVDSVGRLAAQHRASPFMVLLAAWMGFLARVGGQREITVGAPIQARHQPQVADLVGCFVNTICLRQNVDVERPFRDLLLAVRECALDAYDHQDTPVELIVDRLLQRRDPSRTPLFQAMFSHQQVSRRPNRLGDLEISQVHVNPAATPTDLMLAVMEGSTGARGVLHYSTDLFSRETVVQLRRRFEAFLEAALAQPTARVADLPIITAAESESVVHRWNETAHPLDNDLLCHQRFAAMTRSQPNSVAVIDAAGSRSYRQVDDRARAIAAQLSAIGIGAGDVVGVNLQRSGDLVAAILAIWKRGGVYLPLDPEFPRERLVYMVEQSAARAVISTTDVMIDEIAAMVPAVDLDALPAIAMTAEDISLSPPRLPSDLAYILFTSGSTGKPKGVEIPHSALSNFLDSMARVPGLLPADRLLAVTTISFDISILELLLPLWVGASLVIASRDDALDGGALTELLDRHAVTAMQATPSTWRLLIDAGWQGTRSLKVLCGGEALPPPLAADLLRRSGELWNMYGPTETTIWSTLKRITDPDDITIGRPIANTTIYILDGHGQPLPPGIAGELWIGGAGVARGYIGNPQLTADRFRDDPFVAAHGSRIYNTGDFARFRHDGDIEYQQRRDNQVKVRGYRIELGEIETALVAYPAVGQCVAVVREDTPGDVRIVAYLVLRPGRSATPSELRRWLRRTLPDYMIPQFFVELPVLPMTRNAKIDRKALPRPEGGRVASHDRVAPRTESERQMAEIWRELLGVDSISVTDNFFELGGQSLQAAQMVARVQKRCGHKLSPRAVVFESLEQLAAGAG